MVSIFYGGVHALYVRIFIDHMNNSEVLIPSMKTQNGVLSSLHA